jgi:WD40 repeat protein
MNDSTNSPQAGDFVRKATQKKFFPMKNQQTIVIAGTYERLLYGLIYPDLKESFIYPSHISCIKSIAISNRFLATGSTDEHVRLYDLKLRKEIGSLMHHTGTITSIIFVKNYLIISSEDATISIVRTSDWELVKVLKGHSDFVLGMDVHPQASVLLSIGRDKTLKCWDLAKAHLSYSMKLEIVPSLVKFSKDGKAYLLGFDKKVQIHVDEEEKSVEFKQRINAICCTVLGENQVWIAGGEDKIIRVYDFDGNLMKEWNSNHSLRIKDMDVLGTILVTCSSDGTIHTWNLDTFELVTKYDCKTRLTCIKIGICDEPKEKVKVVHEYPESDFDEVLVKKQKITVIEEVDGKKRVLTKKKK